MTAKALEELKEEIQSERRKLNGVIMKDLEEVKVKQDKFEAKVDSIIDTIHNIDMSVNKIQLLFENQVPQCQSKFFEIQDKNKSTRQIAIENKDKIEKYVNQGTGAKMTVGVMSTIIKIIVWSVPVIAGIFAFLKSSNKI